MPRGDRRTDADIDHLAQIVLLYRSMASHLRQQDCHGMLGYGRLLFRENSIERVPPESEPHRGNGRLRDSRSDEMQLDLMIVSATLPQEAPDTSYVPLSQIESVCRNGIRDLSSR